MTLRDAVPRWLKAPIRRALERMGYRVVSARAVGALPGENSPEAQSVQFTSMEMSPTMQLSPTVSIAMMDDWWRLSRGRPQYREVSMTPLKDYGYLELRTIIDETHPRTVLEFGHGLWVSPDKTLFEYHDKLELWMVDKCQNLHYFPQGPEWDLNHSYLVARYPQAHMVKALIGTPEGRQLLPTAHFDLVCSVSVLEEIPLNRLPPIFEHCFDLLAPGGLFAGTHDLLVGDDQRLPEVIRMLRSAGFDAADAAAPNWSAFERKLLLENPTGAMCHYQGHQGEERLYEGHWTTAFLRCRKPIK